MKITSLIFLLVAGMVSGSEHQHESRALPVVKPCKLGQFGPGDSNCQKCIPGYVSNEDRSGCLPCEEGLIPTRFQARCRPCPPGQFSPKKGARKCSRCPVGTRVNKARTGCVKCPMRQISVPRRTRCARCKPGYKPNKAQGKCVLAQCPSKFASAGPPPGDNPCEGKNPGFENIKCIEDAITMANEQSGVNVTAGYNGNLDTDAVPILEPYYTVGMCPVNVHWHLGTEHLSVGEYDETGSGPSHIEERRRLAGKTRSGFQCTLYDEHDEKFTKKYNWEHCDEMEVGQTYEIHWPHSAAGACGTVNQYQTPFLDGVFCRDNIITSTSGQIGVQAQVFTVVNDEAYYYPDLIRGMIVDGEYGQDIAKYTGSTTGTSRDNEICSQYSPITWQVDRKCHLVSASSFDKLCADMKAQRDDMTKDLYPHGSRELVSDDLAANNHHLLM